MKLILFSFALALAFLAAFAFAENVSIRGVAFSPNVGEIGLEGTAGDGTAYGMMLDNATGDFSGYGWSEYIGWIRFDPPGPYPLNIPQAPQHSARLLGGTIEGWARACGVFSEGLCSGALRDNAERGGWDGWILLSGRAVNNDPYGVSLNPQGELTGWAWGSAPVGWIDFSGQAPRGGGLVAYLSADPSFGRPPLIVLLTATASGGSGPFVYHFDCENDGTYDIEETSSDAIHTASVPCVYTTSGSRTALVFVEAEDGAGATAFAVATIRVLQRDEDIPR